MGIRLNKIKNYVITSVEKGNINTEYYKQVQDVLSIEILSSEHHFSRLPIVTILDLNNFTINANVSIHPTNYRVFIQFNQSFSGVVFLN